MDDEDLEVKIQ